MQSKSFKVKVVKVGSPSYWYSKMIGQVFEVEDILGSLDYQLTNDNIYRLAKDDCHVISLRDELETAKTRVAEIEKQLAEEAAIEAAALAARPFTKEQYEKVVAEYRACAGRKKFENGTRHYVLDISGENKVGVESWRETKSIAPFGVFFTAYEYVESAITKVGADNLRKAFEYEMNIGLPNA